MSLWRRALARAALVPLVVLAPLVALAPTADHRFNVYWHGALFRDDPLRIVPHTLGTLPGYLRAGNFRLLGRMLEKLLDLVAYTLGDVFGLPADVALRLVSFASAVLLCAAAVVLAESVVARGPLFREPPSTVAAVVPFACGAALVAAGGASPVVLFGGLYFASAAVVLAVPAALCRIGPDRRIRVRWWLPLVAAGAALAAFNEIAYLALPLATAAVAARGKWVLGLLWAGFLPVFVAVRVVIGRYCAAGPCYRGSDVAAGPEALAAFPVRLLAWLPPLEWQSAVRGGSHRPWLSGVVLVVALVALAVLARHALRDLPRLGAVPRPAAVALAAVALGLIVLGAGLGALNGDVQQVVAAGRWGQGWRDSAVTIPGGAVLLGAMGHLLRPRRAVLAGVVVLLAAGAVVSATANKRFRDSLSATAAARLENRIAQEMADFDPTAAGAARRCALRAEYHARYAASPFTVRRFDESLDAAAGQRGGVPFCPAAARVLRRGPAQ